MMGGDRRRRSNEVYRSNSFKFEKYEREGDPSAYDGGVKLQNQVGRTFFFSKDAQLIRFSNYNDSYRADESSSLKRKS